MSSINLLATQESVLRIFSTQEEVYVIPPYQRPYSWSFDAYKQMYDDITSAYLDGKRDYFLGNIVVARGDDYKNYPEIVDGQQRIVTLWMILKALSVLVPEMSRLSRTLVSESIISDKAVCKIKSQVIENNDDDIINDIWNLKPADVDKFYREFKRQGKSFNKKGSFGVLKGAFINIYHLFNEFFKNLGSSELKIEFITYFLEKVYLLPIELKGITVQDANNNALMIFETLNNRGQNLSNADIFKAEIYKMALNENAKDNFLAQWQELRDICKRLNLNMDDPFRYYYHIIRAQLGLTSSEVNLRTFFMTNDSSPLLNSSYKSIMSNLMRIVESIANLKSMVKGDKAKENPELAKWLQILYAYTNSYPWFALVCYTYFKGTGNKNEFLDFVKTLIRFFYQTGSSITNVKYETSSINKRTYRGAKYETYYNRDSKGVILDNPGKLIEGLSLLSYYLQGNDFTEDYYLNRIISSKDLTNFNFMVSDFDGRRPESLLSNYFISGTQLLSSSINEKLKELIDDLNNNRTLESRKSANIIKYTLLNNNPGNIADILHVRNSEIRELIMDFFSGPNHSLNFNIDE